MALKPPPAFTIFWADTKKPLTHTERKRLEGVAVCESLTPYEVLLRDQTTDRRLIVVRKAGDPYSPFPPGRRLF